MVKMKHHAKFVVEISDAVNPDDITEGMRVGVSPNNHKVGEEGRSLVPRGSLGSNCPL